MQWRHGGYTPVPQFSGDGWTPMPSLPSFLDPPRAAPEGAEVLHVPLQTGPRITQAGPTTWTDRITLSQNTWQLSRPMITAQLNQAESDRPQENLPLLDDFRHAAQRRQDRMARTASGGSNRPAQSPWEHLTDPAGAGPTGVGEVGIFPETLIAVNDEFHTFASRMAQHQQGNELRHEDARSQRMRCAARQLARLHGESNSASETDPPDIPVDRNPGPATCAICFDALAAGDTIAMLACNHAFHLICVDEWAATASESGWQASCPVCRADLVVASRYERAITEPAAADQQLGTPDSGASYATVNSQFVAPWWPAEGEYDTKAAPFFHATTQLPNGRLSIIIDPGAWTNLCGLKFARELTKRASEHDHKVVQKRMTRPLDVQGVGNGSQRCEWEISCPIAVPSDEGTSRIHKITAPIVQGTGADLPGLLGLRSLEHERALLDCGNRVLHLVGKGEVQIQLPPGSTSIPLQKAPSGHLVMVVDDFENAVRKQGGLPEQALQLHSAPGAAPSSSSAASSLQPIEPACPTQADSDRSFDI